MSILTEPLAYEFMQRALLAGIAVAAVCAVIGVFIVQRGLAFLGDGLAHAAFGGIAIGLDRWAALFAEVDNIREVMAFPKTQSGTDLMMDAPSPIAPEQLDELRLRVVEKP